MLAQMHPATRLATLALFTAALASMTSGRATAQETQYDPEGRALPPTAVPDGYVAPDAGTPAETAPPAPVDAIPAPPAAAEGPPAGRYNLDDDAAPHYPRAALSGREDETTDEGIHLPSRISARLRVLDRDYMTLSARGSNGILDGILSITTGGLSIVLGAVLPDTANDFATYLYLFGVGGVAHGIVELFITPDPTDPALIFANMPMRDVDEVKARLRFGEESLERLADRSLLSRVLEGSIDIATGVAFVPFYLGPRDYAFSGSFLDIVVMTAALIRVISGVATLLIRSDAERRWSAYVDLRDALRRQHQEQRRVHARLGAAPLPGGGALTLSGAF